MIDKEQLENFLKEGYKTLKGHKQFIANIDKDFFFDLVDYLLLREQKVINALEDRIKTTTNRPDYGYVGTEWEEVLVVEDWAEILSILKGETEDDR